ncbi:MAG: helix-turn-helix domain-containing protein [Firmicutes bacterium]|nr:helix-turn-helix domain-containing protein [Bacillota bacterium]
MKNPNKGSHDRLPKQIICAAIHGDELAMNAVLEHYERYIDKMATKQARDMFGNVEFVVDPYLKRILETQLILSVLKFKAS